MSGRAPTITPTALPEVLVVEQRRHRDGRGWVEELWRREAFAEVGIDLGVAQVNHARTTFGALRGLHYQSPSAQGKLVSVLSGEILDVVVDIRVGSPRFGRHVALRLGEEGARQLWVPPGFAHGFCCTSASADVIYTLTAPYDPGGSYAIAWNDRRIGVDWRIDNPRLSERDAAAPPLSKASRLPLYEGLRGL